MDRQEYKSRLKQFNETTKYQAERNFLIRLLNPQKEEKILDYGTGLGRMVHYLNFNYGTNCFGYDLHNLREVDDEMLFRTEFFFKFQKVFFMHSIAHIHDLERRLVYLRENLLMPKAKIVVITPNMDWLSIIDQMKDYVSDNTVITHFNSAELKQIFETAGYKVTVCGQFGEIKKGQHERIFLEATNE